MGGTSSQPVQVESEDNGIFSLSAEMQEQLAQDFHNEQIVKLFGKQMEKIGERRAAILQGSLEQRATLQQHMTAFRERDAQIQQKLDAAIEGLEDRFSDAATSVDYDRSRLEQKYLGASTGPSEKVACFVERSDIATCYQQNKTDVRACDPFVQALTKCTEKTVTGSP
jgi:hypothetical protein